MHDPQLLSIFPQGWVRFCHPDTFKQVSFELFWIAISHILQINISFTKVTPYLIFGFYIPVEIQ